MIEKSLNPLCADCILTIWVPTESLGQESYLKSTTVTVPERVQFWQVGPMSM